MQERIQPGAVVFGSWTVHHRLGEGSFGQVFELRREDFGETYRAALKVISVPQSPAEVQAALEEGMTREQAERYFYGVVEDVVREFAIMAKLKGTANVVGYEDHEVVRHAEGIGWDILIRMELLTPLLPYAYAHPFTRRDVIRLGIDVCKALELCQKYNVIHRDVKPENIFVSENGDFKLGDFGIARTIDRTVSGLSKKGTFNFMAPEVYRGGEYGFSVDLYSLGLVLYRLLNRNRLPFLPPPPEPITFRQREESLARRMRGETLPVPAHGEGRLGEILLKACAFDPRDRYSSPGQMRAELEAILYDETDASLIYPDGDELTLAENQYLSGGSRSREASAGDEGGTASVFGGPQKEKTSSVSGEPGGAASALSGEPGEKTSSVFSGAGNGGTVSVFTGAAEEGGTVSIFSGGQKKAAESGGKERKADSEGAEKPKKRRGKALLLAGVLCAVLVGTAGFLAWNGSRLAAEQEQTYLTLMEEGAALCSGAPQEAAEKFLAAQSLRPEEPAPYVSYAYALYLSGETEACISYVENDLALGKSYDEKTQSELAAILGAAYFEQEDYAAAASFFRLSTAGGDITVDAMRDYAVSLGRLGDVEAADEVLAEMREAGASGELLNYVQAEVDRAKGDYAQAVSGFSSVLGTAQERVLQTRAVRSLAETYLECAALDASGSSPVAAPAETGAAAVAEALVRYDLSGSAVLQDLLGRLYYEAGHAGGGEECLRKAADAFRQALSLGGNTEAVLVRLFFCELETKQFDAGKETLEGYEKSFPQSYVPHALRGLLLIAEEEEKPEESREYSAVLEAYEAAGEKLQSGDDPAYYQQLEALVGQLRDGGWL